MSNENSKLDAERAAFEAYMLGREHPVFGWIDGHWFGRGDDPATYANDYVQGCWVMWQARSLPVGVPDSWPRLGRPAKVGAGVFAAGLSTRLVVEAAYRQYEYAAEPPFTDGQIKSLAALAAAPTVKSEKPDMVDAYVGAREDLTVWKRRALEAEAKVRHQEQIIDHLTLEAQGETRFGEPSMPSAEPVAVIEYAGYDPANSIKWLNKGLQYMEPGTLLYAQAPSLPAAGSAVQAKALRAYDQPVRVAIKMLECTLYPTAMEIAAELRRCLGDAQDALSAQQSAPVTNETSPLEVIGYASPGQIAILRELPRTGGMKVKGRKDDRYSEPLVLLSDARSAMISLAARCQQEGAFKTCLECGYQDGHDEICQFHASNRMVQQSAPERVSVPKLAGLQSVNHQLGIVALSFKSSEQTQEAVRELRTLLAKK